MSLFIEHCKNGNIDEKEFIKQCPVNYMKQNNFTDGFKCARENGHNDVVSYLAEKYSSPYIFEDREYDCDWNRNAHDHLTYIQKCYIKCFVTACFHGNYYMVQYFVEAYKTDNRHVPIDIHIAKEYGFVLACGDGKSYDIVRYLCELHKNDTNYKPIDIHANNEDGFRRACSDGHYDIVRYLCELYKNDDKYGPIDIHAEDESGFKFACHNGRYDIVQYLVELHENDPNYKPMNINNIIGYANANKKYEIIKYLMELNASR